MDQRYGITRILFNQSLTCPIAFAEMIRRFGIMTATERTTFIASLDMAETGAMLVTTSSFSDPLSQLAMAMMTNMSIEMADLFVVMLGTHAASLFHLTLDELLANDPPHELIDAGFIYTLNHAQP